MELRHLRHFVAVAEELHFGRAAARLHIAQPPLSQSIRRLEDSVGVTLFDRSRRSVTLTAAGKIFLREAQRTLMQAALACKLAQREAAKLAEVRLAFIGPFLYRVLPDLVRLYRSEAPPIHLRLFERSSSDQVASLESGDFDVGFVQSSVARPSGLDAFTVEKAPTVAVVPASLPLADQDSVTLEDLADQPFIMPSARYLGQISDTLAVFAQKGLALNVTQEALQTNTTISLVGAGIGCSLVPATAALAHTRNVRFLPIADASLPPMEIVMLWKTDQISQEGRDFVMFVKKYIAHNPRLLEA